MTDDEDLRRVFTNESQERLDRIELGLLALERGEATADTRAQLFRDAHSLKGGASMLGLPGVHAIAHVMEDLFHRAQRSEGARVPAPLIEALMDAVDTMRALVREFGTGAAEHVDVEAALRRLREATFGTQSPARARSEPTEPAPTPAADLVRVSPQRLDALLDYAGELGVLASRIHHRRQQIDELYALAHERTRADALATTRVMGGVREMSERLLVTTEDDAGRLERIAREVGSLVRETRLVPLASLFTQFPRLVRDLAHEQSKEVRFKAEAGETAADRRIVEQLRDPLVHLLRNAVDHGVESREERARSGKPAAATIRLTASRTGAATLIELSDDGRGIDLDRVRAKAVDRGLVTPEEANSLTSERLHALLFEPGFSTRDQVTSISGRGVGLDVARTAVESLKGTIELDSRHGEGATFRLRIPLTLETAAVLIVRVRGRLYGIPSDAIQTLRSVSADDIFPSEGRDAIMHADAPTRVERLGDVLGVQQPPSEAFPPNGVVVDVSEARLALLVDELVDEQEVLVKTPGAWLRDLRHVVGAAILGTGEICLILNPNELARMLVQGHSVAAAAPSTTSERPPTEARARERQPLILLVEDSITTRVQEKRILEAAGYRVLAAVDGLDALAKLQAADVAAVVTDVEMPRMDGFSLTQRLRKDRRYRELPIILVTSLVSTDDRRRGVELGADAYITKSEFDQDILIQTLRRLVP